MPKSNCNSTCLTTVLLQWLRLWQIYSQGKWWAMAGCSHECVQYSLVMTRSRLQWWSFCMPFCLILGKDLKKRCCFVYQLFVLITNQGSLKSEDWLQRSPALFSKELPKAGKWWVTFCLSQWNEGWLCTFTRQETQLWFPYQPKTVQAGFHGFIASVWDIKVQPLHETHKYPLDFLQ